MKTKDKVVIVIASAAVIVPVLIISFIAILNLLREPSSLQTSFAHHEENIEVLSSTVNSSMAEEINRALEITGSITENTELSSENFYELDNGEYEIYVGLSLRLCITDSSFKLYTYETIYTDDTRILLFDSTKKESLLTLNEESRDALISSQREYLVTHTIQITPRIGPLLHNALGQSKLSFEIKNTSDTPIGHVQILINPEFIGSVSTINESWYSYYDSIDIEETKTVTLTTKIGSEWTNYDYYVIKSVIVFFEDGTSISFNEEDCKYL